MCLADHGVAVVGGENDDIDGRGVIGHANGAWFGTVLSIMKCDDGGEDARENAMKKERGIPIEPSFERSIFDEADQESRKECIRTSEYEQDQSKIIKIKTGLFHAMTNGRK